MASLPPLPTPFVGRDADVAAIVGLVEQSRLVTVAGPPGVGKTTVVVAVARALGARDHDVVPDVLFRDASQIRDLQTVLPAWSAATALGPALLILDGFDHLVEGAGALVSWLNGAPHVRLLITSRTVLRVALEQVYPLQPLASSGVELLVERRRQSDPGYAPDEAERAALDTIVERTDGVPLALVLAASRLRVLSAPALAERLEDQLAVLRTRGRDVPPRHRSLTAALESSWQALDPAQRQALRACAVFAATFSTAAAEIVVDDPDGLDLLSELRDRSLLHSPRAGAFRLYDMVREFVNALGPDEVARARHRTYYAERAFVAQAAIERGEAVARWARWLAESREELVRAASGAPPLLAARIGLAALHDFSGRGFQVPEDWDQQGELAARARWALCQAGHPIRRAAEAGAAIDAVLNDADFDALEQDLRLAIAWCALRSRAADLRRDETRALACLSGALNDPETQFLGRFFAHRGLARNARARRDTDASIEHYRAAYEVARMHGAGHLQAVAGVVLATVQLNLGQLEVARANAREAMGLGEELDLVDLRFTALSVTAGVHLDSGAPAHAARDFRAMSELAGRLQRPHWQTVPAVYAAMADLEGGHAERALASLTQIRAAAQTPREHLNGLADAFAALAAKLLEQDELALDRLARARADVTPGSDEARAVELAASFIEGTTGGPTTGTLSFEERSVTRLIRARATGAQPVVRPLRLTADGKQIETPTGEVVDLSRRKLLRGLVGALVQARLARPGACLGLDELAEVGWPGSQLRREVIKNRLYVAMTRLRDAGLRDYVETTPEGWRIPVDLPVLHGIQSG